MKYFLKERKMNIKQKTVEGKGEKGVKYEFILIK
jgi:hypothetical protein